jgi:hypothetical protein
MIVLNMECRNITIKHSVISGSSRISGEKVIEGEMIDNKLLFLI